MNNKKEKLIKVTNKVLADYLGVSEQAVKQYPKIKTQLMKKGLFHILNEKEKKSLEMLSAEQITQGL